MGKSKIIGIIPQNEDKISLERLSFHKQIDISEFCPKCGSSLFQNAIGVDENGLEYVKIVCVNSVCGHFEYRHK